jgi:hypothetical protein
MRNLHTILEDPSPWNLVKTHQKMLKDWIFEYFTVQNNLLSPENYTYIYGCLLFQSLEFYDIIVKCVFSLIGNRKKIPADDDIKFK